jgi:hypothetical protein
MRSSNRGFSVVEIMVALLVGVNVLAILWQVFTSDQKRFARDSGKLGAMQGALLFAERLETDLREIALEVPDAGNPNKLFTLDRPVTLEDGGRKLGFLRFKAHDPASPLVKVERATYSYDPQEYRIRRTVGTETTPFKTLVVEAIKYDLVTLTARFDQLGITPPPVVFRPQVPMNFLKYEITAAPETGRGRTPADIAPEQKVTLVNAVALLYRADRSNHPYWVFSGSELPAQP